MPQGCLARTEERGAQLLERLTCVFKPSEEKTLQERDEKKCVTMVDVRFVDLVNVKLCEAKRGCKRRLMIILRRNMRCTQRLVMSKELASDGGGQASN